MNEQPWYSEHPSHESQHPRRMYMPPNAPVGYARPPESGKGMAITGLVIGIVSLVIAFVPLFGIIPPVLGIIFSAIGMRSVSCRGQAQAGLICSIIAVFLALFMIAVYSSAG